MHIDSTGDVHLVWSWAYDHARGLRHYGSYLRYDPSDRDVLRNIFNTVVTLPVNLSTPDLFYQGLGGGESFHLRGLRCRAAKRAGRRRQPAAA